MPELSDVNRNRLVYNKANPTVEAGNVVPFAGGNYYFISKKFEKDGSVYFYRVKITDETLKTPLEDNLKEGEWIKVEDADKKKYSIVTDDSLATSLTKESTSHKVEAVKEPSNKLRAFFDRHYNSAVCVGIPIGLMALGTPILASIGVGAALYFARRYHEKKIAEARKNGK